MRLRAFAACVRKELLLLRRDLHALALLFIMPLAFVLIMSLAMRDEFAQRTGRNIAVLAIDRDPSSASQAFLAALDAHENVSVRAVRAADPDAKERLRAGEFAFVIDIAAEYDDQLTQPTATPGDRIGVIVGPDTTRQTEMAFLGALRETLARERVKALLGPLGVMASADDGALEPSIEYLQGAQRTAQTPNAVQQSVPAWLVFGAFFVVIPLSNTLARERQHGTLRRLRTMPVSGGELLAGKLAPYFVVNQLQMLVMLAAGVWLAPALGGEALQLRGSTAALMFMSCALSIAALGYGLLIASATRTSEQATLVGGAGNLILGALGGVMVPKFVMPPAMQAATDASPMGWALDGFLDVLLRDGSLRMVLGEGAALIAFGAAALIAAAWLHARRTED